MGWFAAAASIQDRKAIVFRAVPKIAVPFLLIHYYSCRVSWSWTAEQTTTAAIIPQGRQAGRQLPSCRAPSDDNEGHFSALIFRERQRRRQRQRHLSSPLLSSLAISARPFPLSSDTARTTEASAAAAEMRSSKRCRGRKGRKRRSLSRPPF